MIVQAPRFPASPTARLENVCRDEVIHSSSATPKSDDFTPCTFFSTSEGFFCNPRAKSDQQSQFMSACGNGPSPVSSAEVLTVLESTDQFSFVPT